VKINVTMPFDRTDAPDEFVRPEAVAEVGAVLDRTGFNAALVTDHPCPTGRWLEAGGHHAQDPFVMLSLIAAHTKRVRLQTGILVLPYRNPFITARSIATLDVFSGGRVTLSVGAGYLKGEYKALGADFDSRNDIMDEYILAMKAAWTSEEFTFKGTGYEALGNRIVPLPLQKPHPPIYIGGNSKRAIRRAVELADGWVPFPNTASMAQYTRTPAMETLDDLAARISFAREHAAAIGRREPFDICYSLVSQGSGALDPHAAAERIAALRELGVTWLTVGFPAATRGEYVAAMQQFSREVVG